MSFGKAPKHRLNKSNAATSERKSRDAGSKVGGSKTSYGSKTQQGERISKGNPYYIYKRVVDLTDNNTMDEGVSRVLCEDQCGANATSAIALYSWMLRNVKAWGADQVRTTFFEGDQSGIACVRYDSIVLMNNSEEKTISVEFYGKPC